MSNANATSIFTRDIMEIQEAVDKGDKKLFLELFNDKSGRLNNCSCGDSYLQQAYLKICHQAIEKFILGK